MSLDKILASDQAFDNFIEPPEEQETESLETISESVAAAFTEVDDSNDLDETDGLEDETLPPTIAEAITAYVNNPPLPRFSRRPRLLCIPTAGETASTAPKGFCSWKGCGQASVNYQFFFSNTYVVWSKSKRGFAACFIECTCLQLLFSVFISRYCCSTNNLFK